MRFTKSCMGNQVKRVRARLQLCCQLLFRCLVSFIYIIVGLNLRLSNIIAEKCQVYYWIGWKPDRSQPKPLKPQKSDVSWSNLIDFSFSWFNFCRWAWKIFTSWTSLQKRRVWQIWVMTVTQESLKLEYPSPWNQLKIHPPKDLGIQTKVRGVQTSSSVWALSSTTHIREDHHCKSGW